VQKLAWKHYKKSGLNTAGKPLIRKMKHRKESIKERFKPILLTNDDTAKQLYQKTLIIQKKKSKWSKTKQNEP
jgi:hypothetical protein